MTNMKTDEKKANNQDTYKYTEVATETDDLKNNEKESSIQDTFTYKEALELTGNGRYNYLLLTTCSLITNACALDMFGYATVVAAASCDLNVELKQLGFLASAPFAGVLFAFPWGYYADTRGRKRAMLLSTSVGFIFAVISAFSTHWLFMFIVKIICCSLSERKRIMKLGDSNTVPLHGPLCMNFFSTASFTLTMALLGECTGKKHRSQYLFIMNSLNLSSDVFAFGLAWLILPLDFRVNLPLLNMTFRPWRLYTIALAIPLGIGAVLLFYIYESPEFLASRGDNKKASEVLKMIYEKNGGKRENYPVRHITQTGLSIASKSETFWKTLIKQTVPIFKPPLLWRTIQLYFLLALCCVTNNAFTMWYPTIVNYFFKSFNTSDSSEQSFCQRLFGDSSSQLNNTQTLECNDEISANTIYAGMVYGVFYWLMSTAVVKVSSRPRMLLIAVLLVSGVSELLVNLKNPIANMIFFTLLQATSLGVGCISSYFVNLYPALHRGLVTSLGMMVARLCSLTAVSLVGAAITQHCEATFYIWSAFVFGGVIVCLFLPADRIQKKLSIIDSPT